MVKYRCLVLDHDDTVVQSSLKINYPAFVEVLHQLRPQRSVTLEEFTLGCFHKTFAGFCLEDMGYSPKELEYHYEQWKAYVRTHIPPVYPGFPALLHRFRRKGGIICVSSHSGDENISRDYLHHFGFLPDHIYSFDLPQELQKPAPFALQDIMDRYHLEPTDLLMVDDMKSGFDMACACGVPFACAGWSHQLPEITQYMKANTPVYLNSVEELSQLIFGE